MNLIKEVFLKVSYIKILVKSSYYNIEIIKYYNILIIIGGGFSFIVYTIIKF
jgi:hypothetical protein